MSDAIKIQFPETNEFDKYTAYLRITMKSFTTNDSAWSNAGDLFGDYTGKVVDAGISIIKSITGGKDELAINDIAKTNVKRETGFNLGKNSEILIFETYIPADFGVSLTADWSSTELISTEKIVEAGIKGTAKGFGSTIGNFVNNQYGLVKNQLQYLSNQTLTPLEIKQFKPSFLDQTINFDFRPQNKSESIKIINALKMLKQGVIPNSKNGEWFDYPALFDVKVMLKENDGNGVPYIVNNPNSETTDLFTNFKDLGMTSFNMSSDSGNNVELKFRADGSLPVYKVSMSFTSTKKYYEDDGGTVSKRVSSIADNMKTELGKI